MLADLAHGDVEHPGPELADVLEQLRLLALGVFQVQGFRYSDTGPSSPVSGLTRPNLPPGNCARLNAGDFPRARIFGEVQ